MLVPRESLTPTAPPPPPAAPEEGLHAPPIPSDLLGEAARAELGRGKVARGLVHPYFSTLGQVLVKRWDADRAVSRRGLQGFGAQLAENSRDWNRVWLERAQAFGQSGSPTGPDTVRDVGRLLPPPGDERGAPGVSGLAAKRAVQRQMREAFKASRKATLRVVQDASGKLLSVELVRPSNDAHVDREAVQDVRAAAQALPPPPTEALAGRLELISLWEFELIVSLSPPVPSFSFEFDEALGFIDARLPLDRRIYKRVRLVAVE